jgi:hypothetical protein
MVEAQAEMKLGEAIAPATIAHSRIYRGDARLFITPLLAFLGIVAIAAFVSMLLPLVSLRLTSFDNAIWTVGGLFGILVAFRLLYRLRIRGFLAGLRSLGSPDVFPTRFEFGERGVAIGSERMSYGFPWASVQFIMPSPQHWLIQVDTATFAVPFRAFAGDGEQKFLEIASASLTEAARVRSVLARQ